MSTIYDTTNPRLAEIANSFPFRDWMQVLARPHLFQMLTRQPSREHLLMLCDAYLPYARSRRELAKEQGYVSHADEAVMSELAGRMRVLMESWTPHNLTPEIVDTARALLSADMSYMVLAWDFTPELNPDKRIDLEIVKTTDAPPIADRSCAVPDWDYTPALEPGETLADILIWPSSPWRPK